MSRHFRQKAMLLPKHISRAGCAHVTHAKATAAEEGPAESFEAIFARLGVKDLREAKVKDLSAICGRLGIARSGNDCSSPRLSGLHVFTHKRGCIAHSMSWHHPSVHSQGQTRVSLQHG